MPQTPEAQAFIQRIQALPKEPGIILDDVLKPSLADEAELRKLFATDKQNTRLNDKHVGLVNVFEAPVDIRTIRARKVKDEDDLSAKYVMPLSDEVRKKDGEQAMVLDLEEFKKNWSVFTEGSLSQLLDWNNVIAAGGSVLACLAPLSEADKTSKRAIRKFYHSNAYPTSDIDLFLYGMTPAEAEVKITKIYEAVRDSVPWDVTCVRTKHTVSIHSQYPYRSVQIVLRLYSSPAEVLAGFDIDSACFAYDGSHVWGNPRGIVSMMRQCNTVDMTRRSPSYEVRLAKYSSRSFEVYVPTLNRADVDPTIYERAITRVEGLARLLAFEKLKDSDSRTKFLESRRALRGRPQLNQRYRRKKQFKGDLKANMMIGGLEMNDYDVQSLHIPYGPGWDARRIEKLVYQTDLGMNSPFNPKNKDRRLHRHPAFFGTADECLSDCCEFCPNPIDEDEKKLQKDEDEQYTRGRISFIEEDPGRQSMTGSFKPIDVGEWSQQVYIGPTEKFFAAIVNGDGAAVAKMIEEGIDPTRRDHVGRMPLHVAILAKQADIACNLIDNGARITSRLADGRHALHLAAKMDMVEVVKKLIERSQLNAEHLKKEDKGEDVEMKDAIPERASSEDDWTSDDNGVISMDEDMADDEDGSEDSDESVNVEVKKDADEVPVANESGELPEDKDDEPDVFDFNAPDWDLALTPLHYAILYASTPVIDVFLAIKDIDLSVATQGKQYDSPALHPLTVTQYREDENEAAKIVELLVAAGASCSTADQEGMTLFSQLIFAGKTQLVLTLLRVDPNAMSVINFPSFPGRNHYDPKALFPISYAIEDNNYAMVAILATFGGLKFKEEDVSEAWNLFSSKDRSFGYSNQPENRLDMVIPFLETSLAKASDLIHLLVPLGAPVDVVTAESLRRYASKDDKMSLLEWVVNAIDHADKQIEDVANKLKDSDAKARARPQNLTPWKSLYFDRLELADTNSYVNIYQRENDEKMHRTWIQIKAYLVDAERLLSSKTSKTYQDLYPNDTNAPEPRRRLLARTGAVVADEPTWTSAVKYQLLDARSWSGSHVPLHQTERYDELFEACMKGDNTTIQRLCLPTGTNSEKPLQIQVKAAHATDAHRELGLTPLSVAVANRHWETAKLIFTISARQYKPDGKDPKFKVNLAGFHEDSDEEGSDDDSMASDDTVDNAPINFVDVAKRPSEVQVPVPPSKMLHDVQYWTKNEKENGSLLRHKNMLEAAVYEDDAQAFANIFNLYHLSDPPVKLTTSDLDSLLTFIISRDRVELLDQFIRKTGVGITVRLAGKNATDDEDPEIRATNDKNKVYHGLNVHGKKRKDLAKKNDPNAVENVEEKPPLVWRAAVVCSFNIVEYLKSDRPHEAYRHYAMCNSDELAIALRRTSNLAEVLPQWLGWTISSLGESPLAFAVLTRKLSLVKQMFTHDTKLAAAALREHIKFTGYNLLMVAVQAGCTTKMVDFLLSNGLSATETDTPRGWNIFHIIAFHHGDTQLFEYFLKKLPREVSSGLLMQQTKRRLNTPLHVAINGGRKKLVELIINFDKSSLDVRNMQGSLPIHLAVSNNFPTITKMLTDASPDTLLHAENGVGDTPLEMLASNALAARVKKVSFHTPSMLRKYLPYHQVAPPRFQVEGLEKGIAQLRETIGTLTKYGKLSKDSSPEKEFFTFVQYLETQLENVRPEHLAIQKRKEEKEEKEKKELEEKRKKALEEDTFEAVVEGDARDLKETLKIVQEAVAARPAPRQLVHLVDVQVSVQGELREVESNMQSTPHSGGRQRDDDGLEPEADKDTEIRNRSLLFQYHGLGNIDAFAA